MADNQRTDQRNAGQERNPNNPVTQKPGTQGEHSGQRQGGQSDAERNRDSEKQGQRSGKQGQADADPDGADADRDRDVH